MKRIVFFPGPKWLRVLALPGFLCLAQTKICAQEAPGLSAGQTLYVPVYSHIFLRPESEVLLARLHLEHPQHGHDLGIVISSVDYFDTEGKLIRKYLADPLLLPAMGSTHYYIVTAQEASQGGMPPEQLRGKKIGRNWMNGCGRRSASLRLISPGCGTIRGWRPGNGNGWHGWCWKM